MGKRIAHLTSAHGPDDIRIFQKECRSLRTAGYDVILVAPGAIDATSDGVLIRGVPKPRGRLGRFTLTRRRVLKAALQVNAEVYHFHDPDLIPVGLRLKKLGRKVIYDVHEDVEATIKTRRWIPRPVKPFAVRWVRRQERLADKRLDAIIAATPAIARNFHHPRTVVVENFALDNDLGSFESPPLSQRPPDVLYAGGMTAIRGIDVLVAAIARSKVPGARLLLAGPALEPDLRAKVESDAGWTRTVYLGNLSRKELARTMAGVRAGLVLFQPAPNHLESQPNKIFEYMSAGLPVIGSDFPLWRDVIEGNGCGVCVDPTDPAAVAAAIDGLLSDPERAQRMAINGKQAVRQRYGWEAAEQRLLRLYEQLAGG